MVMGYMVSYHVMANVGPGDKLCHLRYVEIYYTCVIFNNDFNTINTNTLFRDHIYSYIVCKYTK